MRKLADHKKISALGWKPKLDFFDSLTETYEDFKKEIVTNKWK